MVVKNLLKLYAKASSILTLVSGGKSRKCVRKSIAVGTSEQDKILIRSGNEWTLVGMWLDVNMILIDSAYKRVI